MKDPCGVVPGVSGRPLLSVMASGGFPDLGPLYRAAGFAPATARSMREALAMLRTLNPEVIVAEFVYGPVYSFRISTLESLIAGIQSSAPGTRLIVLADRADAPHLARLRQRFDFYAIHYFPIEEPALRQTLSRAAAEP
ncbi:MAG: hypothetical protein B7Z66_10800 [Chromatiales bacterium 21-64-14]|nr:MAG: hypothetical protein B7Z66_10800 [Chromatiales bacterium 21-64-14]HQU15626.1 hypothetical protein [Gammaproteobacteria bacterium]